MFLVNCQYYFTLEHLWRPTQHGCTMYLFSSASPPNHVNHIAAESRGVPRSSSAIGLMRQGETSPASKPNVPYSTQFTRKRGMFDKGPAVVRY